MTALSLLERTRELRIARTARYLIADDRANRNPDIVLADATMTPAEGKEKPSARDGPIPAA